MAQLSKRLLLVEGAEELRVIPQLIEQATGLPWGEKQQPKLVVIKPTDGVEKLLSPGYIEAELKTSQLHSLGVLLDADTDPAAQWQALRDRCLPSHPDFPAVPPKQGLVLTLTSGVRLGAWLMPDNEQRGMLETFLLMLRPQTYCPKLWQHAEGSVAQAESLGSPWRDAHRDKALIHTFLAWQDPPGRQLHQAVMQKMLDVQAPAAQGFVAWFRLLYEV